MMPLPSLRSDPHAVLIDDGSRDRLSSFIDKLGSMLDDAQRDLDSRQAEIDGWRAVCRDISRLLSPNVPAPVAQPNGDGPADSTASIPQTAGQQFIVQEGGVEGEGQAGATREHGGGEPSQPSLPSGRVDETPDGPAVTTAEPIPPETVAQTVPDCMPVLSPQAGVGAVASPALAPAARETLEQAVGRAHADHPEWTAREIAEHIGRPYASVQTTLAKVRRAAIAKRQPAPPPSGSFVPSPSRPESVVVGKPMSVPKGARFYLRNPAGEYLHGSCEQMTTVRAYAWIGNRDQLEGCRQRFPLARDLVPQVADTQQRIAA